MHSTINRAQNVFGFFTTVAFSVAALIALSVFISPQTPSATLEMTNVQVARGRPHYYSPKREEYANIRFTLSTSLQSLFTYNTKQLFLYITATYPPPSNSPAGTPNSSAIIWDAIIPNTYTPWHKNHYIYPSTKIPNSSSKTKKAKQTKKDEEKGKEIVPGLLDLSNHRPKYQITDISGKLANRTDVILELGYNMQPWVGALTWAQRSDFGAWKGLVGAQSRSFRFPSPKAKKVAGEDMKVEKGREGKRLEVGLP